MREGSITDVVAIVAPKYPGDAGHTRSTILVADVILKISCLLKMPSSRFDPAAQPTEPPVFG